MVATGVRDAETAAEIHLWRRSAGLFRKIGGKRHRCCLRFDQRFGRQGLAPGEDVEAAPVGAGLDQAPDQRRHAFVIDAERTSEAAHLHPRAL